MDKRVGLLLIFETYAHTHIRRSNNISLTISFLYIKIKMYVYNTHWQLVLSYLSWWSANWWNVESNLQWQTHRKPWASKYPWKANWVVISETPTTRIDQRKARNQTKTHWMGNYLWSQEQKWIEVPPMQPKMLEMSQLATTACYFSRFLHRIGMLLSTIQKTASKTTHCPLRFASWPFYIQLFDNSRKSA